MGLQVKPMLRNESLQGVELTQLLNRSSGREVLNLEHRSRGHSHHGFGKAESD
jgi:hypothetical protein